MLSGTKSDSPVKLKRRLFSDDFSNDIDFLMDQQFNLDRQRMISLWSFDIETCQYLDESSLNDKPSSTAPSSLPTTLSPTSVPSTSTISSPSTIKKRSLSNKENLRPEDPKRRRKRAKTKLSYSS